MNEYEKALLELNVREKQGDIYQYEDDIMELARMYNKERDEVFYDWMDLRFEISRNKSK
ncbi:hypothetical protein ACFQZE_07155 [Paenibacillus sp. GCM10027627]|uniref:hypothetical protein n=1 Tax=unclassified Paenibacillus TaxID=185978 RepID=UPI003641E945